MSGDVRTKECRSTVAHSHCADGLTYIKLKCVGDKISVSICVSHHRNSRVMRTLLEFAGEKERRGGEEESDVIPSLLPALAQSA